MSSATAKTFKVRAPDGASHVNISLSNSSSDYTINLPLAPPNENTALFYDGTDYTWKEVATSIPASSIPAGYETYQVFDKKVLVQSNELEFAPPGAPKVRMNVNSQGNVFFQRYDDVEGKWVGATLVADDD